MDWLDKLSIVVIAGLTLATMGMVTNQEINYRHLANAQAEASGLQQTSQLEIDKNIFQPFDELDRQGRIDQARIKLEEIIKQNPDKSSGYILMARLQVKQGNVGDGVLNYRRAVDMQPDYVDKKTPSFIGREIADVVQKGVTKYSREKQLRPNDQQVAQVLHDVYYLQSRIGGGCE